MMSPRNGPRPSGNAFSTIPRVNGSHSTNCFNTSPWDELWTKCILGITFDQGAAITMEDQWEERPTLARLCP